MLNSYNYVKILSHCPQHVGALTGLGFCRANGGDYSQALALCEQAREADELYAPGYFLKGLILELQKDFPGAVREYQRTLLLEPRNIMAHYNLSRIHRAESRVRDARRALKNALRHLSELQEDTGICHAGGIPREALMDLCRRDMDRLRAE